MKGLTSATYIRCIYSIACAYETTKGRPQGLIEKDLPHLCLIPGLTWKHLQLCPLRTQLLVSLHRARRIRRRVGRLSLELQRPSLHTLSRRPAWSLHMLNMLMLISHTWKAINIEGDYAASNGQYDSKHEDLANAEATRVETALLFNENRCYLFIWPVQLHLSRTLQPH